MRTSGVIVAVGILVLSGCTGAVVEQPRPELTAAAPSATPSPTPIAVDWEPRDQGEQTGAMGAVTVDDRGVPVTYVVTEGDTADQICARFDIWRDSLANEDGVAFAPHPELYPGDVLTFVPSRLATQEAAEE